MIKDEIKYLKPKHMDKKERRNGEWKREKELTLTHAQQNAYVYCKL